MDTSSENDDGTDDGSTTPLEDIKCDYTQYYNAFGYYWEPYTYSNLDSCKLHPNLCPLSPGDTVDLVTVHKPLSRFTPYGHYRYTLVYRDPRTEENIGCLDIRFLY